MTTSPEQVTAQLPPRKRKQEDDSVDEDRDASSKSQKRAPVSKAREIRLEQNRKAARESRRRKKVMIEELQRSVVFFSRANNTLKHQNDDLSRLLMQAQVQVAAIEGQQSNNNGSQSQPVAEVKTQTPQIKQEKFQQAEAQAVATQAVYESQGFSAAAARAAAQTMNGSSTENTAPSTSPPPSAGNGHSLPPMQPGATMQAMANFQQAAAAAMQAAVQGMQHIPGLSVQSLAATASAGATSQQAYNDTMTALAMQQAAAAAAAGQQFFQQNPFLGHSMMAWPGQHAAAPTPSSQH